MSVLVVVVIHGLLLADAVYESRFDGVQLGAVCSAAGVVGTWTSTEHQPGKVVSSEGFHDNNLQCHSGDPSGTPTSTFE